MGTSILELHVRDLDFGELLPVAGVAPVPGAAREAIDPDLLALGMPHHFRRHLGALEHRLAGVHVLAVAREQHLIERHLAPGLGLELTAAGREDGVGHGPRTLTGTWGSVKGAGSRERYTPVHRYGTAPCSLPPCSRHATAYCSVTSRPAGFAIIRNSSNRIIGSSRTSSSRPVCFSSWRRKLGSCSTRYSATSGWRRTASWRSLWSAPARLSERSIRRTTTSGRNTRPVPWHVGHSAVIDCQSEGRTRWRVISISPSSETANALVRARSRPRCVRSSCSTLSRLPRDSMSMKSTTMMPPMSRNRSCRATSRAASRLVLRIVPSGSFFPV